MPLAVTVSLLGEPIQLGLSWREDPAEPGAVYVTRVVPYSPASRADIKLLDRIYGLGGEPIFGQEDLLSRVQQLLSAGAPEIILEIESRGVVREVVIPLGHPQAAPADATL